MQQFLRMITLLMLCITPVFGQIRINDPGRVVERQAENRANRKIDQTVDKGLDKVEEGIGNLFKKKDKKTKETVSEKPASNTPKQDSDKPADPAEAPGQTTETPATNNTLKSYGKFDFIPGEKIVSIEDFSQDAIGDFPARWNTNSSGELVTIEGVANKWLSLGPEGVFYPEFINTLPENFTLEFDLATTSEFSYYSGQLRIIFAQASNPAKDFTKWEWFDGPKTNGLEVGLHPKDAGGKQGLSFFNIFAEAPGQSQMKNEKSFPAFHVPERNRVHVSVWRQKTRLRLYVDDYKLWDLPRAFSSDLKYNLLAFSTYRYHDETDKIFISNLRLAVGSPDTRNKLITEGKFSTTGILFNVNSAIIRPESYGVLKDIASALKENPEVKVKIVGHTDSDGDDATNLNLSQKRAVSVIEALSGEFGIDKSRMESDGKGEAIPAQPNTTAEGKAANRRVEFIRL